MKIIHRVEIYVVFKNILVIFLKVNHHLSVLHSCTYYMGEQTFTITKNHTGLPMHTAIQGILQSFLQWHITSSG